MRIRVPLGTVVKRKREGALLGELTAAGQTLVVARGGTGGLGVVKPKESQHARSKFIEQVSCPARCPAQGCRGIKNALQRLRAGCKASRQAATSPSHLVFYAQSSSAGHAALQRLLPLYGPGV